MIWQLRDIIRAERLLHVKSGKGKKERYTIISQKALDTGAIADDGVEWINARKGFLFPVDVLKKVYRGKFMEFFKEAVTNKSIQFHGILQEIISKYRQFIDTLYNTDWVVYLKESFASPAAVIKYLGAYTNRIAISNSRIKSIINGNVTFSYRDRKNGNVEKLMKLPVEQFIQRFLLHVLPASFVRIRYFGFMANSPPSLRKYGGHEQRRLSNVELLLPRK